MCVFRRLWPTPGFKEVFGGPLTTWRLPFSTCVALWCISGRQEGGLRGGEVVEDLGGLRM